MPEILQFQNLFVSVLFYAVAITTAWALVDALTRNPQAFVAADRQQKKTWLLILGLALAVEVFLGGIGIFAGAVAMLVYHLDVRPALARMTRKR